MTLDHLFIDTETSGLDVDNDCIIALAAIRTDAKGKVLGSFSERIIPTCPVSEGAAKVNGYHKDTWGGLEFTTVMRSFNRNMVLSQDDKVIMVAHNGPEFDKPILASNCRKHDMEIPLHTRAWIDTCALAWPYLFTKQVPNRKLETLCKYFGVEQPKYHDAMSDVKGCHDIYWEMMKRYNVMLMLNDSVHKSKGGNILKIVEHFVTKGL